MSISLEGARMCKFLDFVDKKVSSDTQRLILGVSAIATQPLIDLSNKNVDEETRWTSTMKTIAKIIVGTTVGIIVRRQSINWVKNSEMFWKKAGDKFNIPEYPGKDFWKRASFTQKDKDAINYANTVGTIIGTATGLVTNFIVDAPLTNIFTNFLNKKVKPVCMEKFGHKDENKEIKTENA